MTRLKSPLWITLVVLVLCLIVWLGNTAKPIQTVQGGEDQVLEIQRYPDEPVQLANLRVGSQCVKNRIRTNFKDKASKFWPRQREIQGEGRLGQACINHAA